MADIIVGSTIIGNVIIVLLMLYRGWVGRLSWFTSMTALAVLIDCLFYFIHGFDHSLYAPLRTFIVYWLFPILMCFCVFEAALIGLKWLEYLMLIQVALAAVSLFAHLHADKITIYQLEWFMIYANLAGIVLCILKFRGECNYEPRPYAAPPA